MIRNVNSPGEEAFLVKKHNCVHFGAASATEMNENGGLADRKLRHSHFHDVAMGVFFSLILFVSFQLYSRKETRLTFNFFVLFEKKRDTRSTVTVKSTKAPTDGDTMAN